MVRILPFVSLFFFYSISLGQVSTIDSLSSELKNSRNTRDSVINLSELAIAYLNGQEYNLFKEKTTLLNELCQKSDATVTKAYCYKLNSISNRREKKYELSVSDAKQAIVEFLEIKDTIQVNKSIYSAIKSEIKLKKLREAEMLIQKHMPWIVREYKYKISLEFARYYVGIDDYPKTTDYLELALQAAKESNDPQELGKVYYRMAQLNLDLKSLDEAESNSRKALLLLNDEINRTLYGAACFTLASILTNKKEHWKAVSLFDSAYYYYDKKHTRESQAKVRSRQSLSYLHLREFDSARKAIKEAISISQEIEDERALAFAYSRLGSIMFYADKNSDSAVYYMEHSKKLGQKYNIKTVVKAANYNLGNFLFEQQKYKMAYEHLKDAYKYNDSLYSIEITKRIKEIEAKYDTEKKEKEIATQQNLLQQKDLEKFRLWIVLLALFTLLIGSVSIFLILRSKHMKQSIEFQKTLTKIQFYRAEITKLQTNKKDLQKAIDESDFDEYLKVEYSLTKAIAEYWHFQAYGNTEEQMTEIFEISKRSVRERRQRLYERLSTKTGLKGYTRHSSVSLFLEEMMDFMNDQIAKARES